MRPEDYRVAEKRAREAGTRTARVLPLASRSSGAAVAIRPRSRVAVVLVRDRLGDGGRGHSSLTSWRLEADRSAFDEESCRGCVNDESI